ncbi:hypothetical protein L1987_30249 [Smallanthus sonchifolius]|uniref:Uncharacterized protein n=1 Tax=Smallanthus sonchifolius TaxID=185202 RepID=A0ACB9I324_9ASTR|nr:hypothetical protein L1987_30249 [Smallanthus sonchifolius]
MLSEIEDLKKRLLHGDITVDAYEELLRSLLYPPAGNHPVDLLPYFDTQVKNAMQMQLIVQRQLHDQLEIQRNLQLRIEKQPKKPMKIPESTTVDIYLLGLTWNFDLFISGMQFKDAMQLKFAIQRQLHEQLEIQRNLLFRVEEQSKKLKKMFDQHQRMMITATMNLDFQYGR